MATKEEAEAFLMDFHQKMKIWELRVRNDRGKNSQALLDLEISAMQRMKIIEGLSIRDYADGPIIDTLNAGAPLWVFGQLVKNCLIYIKISIGPPNREVICISFHEAERPMQFPFKGV